MGGTYLCMEGPAFSTKAESNFYRNLGCSVIGMTNHSEARLAREAEIAYSSIAMSTDYDCWHEDHDNVTVDMIIDNLNSNSELAKQIIFKAILEINKVEPSSIESVNNNIDSFVVNKGIFKDSAKLVSIILLWVNLTLYSTMLLLFK